MLGLSQSQQVDETLAYLERMWGSVPRVAEQWPGWGADDQMTFMAEWAIPEERLAELAGACSRGILSRAQGERYASLQDLVGRYRPILARLFRDDEHSAPR